jgi:hypothetical protein
MKRGGRGKKKTEMFSSLNNSSNNSHTFSKTFNSNMHGIVAR